MKTLKKIVTVKELVNGKKQEVERLETQRECATRIGNGLTKRTVARARKGSESALDRVRRASEGEDVTTAAPAAW